MLKLSWIVELFLIFCFSFCLTFKTHYRVYFQSHNYGSEVVIMQYTNSKYKLHVSRVYLIHKLFYSNLK